MVFAGGLQRPRPRILGVVRKFCCGSLEWIGKEVMQGSGNRGKEVSLRIGFLATGLGDADFVVVSLHARGDRMVA